MIIKFPLVFDIRRLLDDLEIIEAYGEAPQISLTHRPNAVNKLTDGNGSLYDAVNQQFLDKESSFTEFNDSFKSTYFYEVYQTISAWSTLRIGRMRLCRLAPHRCYTVHRDMDYRYHLVLQTHPKCYLFFADTERGFHLPADGHLYGTDTRWDHTAFNGSLIDRLHLVFTTYD